VPLAKRQPSSQAVDFAPPVAAIVTIEFFAASGPALRIVNCAKRSAPAKTGVLLIGEMA